MIRGRIRPRAILLTTLCIVVGLAAQPVAAIAGTGDVTMASKKKKKKCPPGTHKVIKKVKNGKRKSRCVPNPTAALSISPATYEFPDEQHGGNEGPTQAFTVSNIGRAASGALTISIVDVDDPVLLDDPAFEVTSSSCAGALPGGASCTVTVMFDPQSNGGDQTYSSVLHVAGTPGGDAQAVMSGYAL